MLLAIPDILKTNKDAWHFSEEEPWKPVANEGAPEDVKKAIADFVSEAQNEDLKQN